MGLSKFFIDRPVFAWVIAVITMLAGGIAAFSLPIEQYPTIAPPAVVIAATYPGADSESLQNSVTQVIEQQLTGLDGLLYFSSSSNANGGVNGREIEVAYFDDASSNANLTGAQNLVQNENVFMIVNDSAFAFGTYRWLLDNGIPLIGGCCS